MDNFMKSLNRPSATEKTEKLHDKQESSKGRKKS